MEKTVSKFTVFFEEPFWVGIYERESNGKYEVSKITFGPEPKDYEVFDFILKNFCKLRFSPSIETVAYCDRKTNPKRMQRAVKKQVQDKGIGTKAQQALKLQHEQGKFERKTSFRDQKEAEKERKFKLNQEKRKEKHKGH